MRLLSHLALTLRYSSNTITAAGLEATCSFSGRTMLYLCPRCEGGVCPASEQYARAVPSLPASALPEGLLLLLQTGGPAGRLPVHPLSLHPPPEPRWGAPPPSYTCTFIPAVGFISVEGEHLVPDFIAKSTSVLPSIHACFQTRLAVAMATDSHAIRRNLRSQELKDFLFE